MIIGPLGANKMNRRNERVGRDMSNAFVWYCVDLVD